MRKTPLRRYGLPLLLMLLFPSYAYAYIDPGTGSYLLQIIIAFLVGVAVALKSFWIQIKSFFMGVFGKKQETVRPESKEDNS